MKWIRIFQTDISSCIVNNGWSTEFFKIKCGARQGCPLSPYLFLICAEILGNGFRHSNKINGIKVENKKFTLSQFADDTQLMLDGTQQSLDEAIKLLETFEKISGLKVNFEKSEIIKMGTCKDTEYHLKKQVKITTDHFKVLGITIPVDGNSNKLIELNYTPAFSRIRKIINTWSNKKLTLFGKTVIIKTLILPQLLYQLSNLPSPPMQMLKTFDELIFKFLWDGRRPKIKKSQLYLDTSHGGLNIPNIYAYCQSLKIKWLRNLLDDSCVNDWKNLFLIRNKFSEVLIKSNISTVDMNKMNFKSNFWKEVFVSWSKIHFTQKMQTDVSKKHSSLFLWHNSNIKINNKSVLFTSWYQKGILYVKDLLNEEKEFLPYVEMKQKYNLEINFVHYFGLINAIKRSISTALITTGDSNEDLIIDKALKGKKHFQNILPKFS